MNKVSLQTCLDRNFQTSHIYIYIFYLFILYVNLENLTIEFYVPYVLNMHIKFCLNWIFFITRSINLFLYTILDHKKLKF